MDDESNKKRLKRLDEGYSDMLTVHLVFGIATPIAYFWMKFQFSLIGFCLIEFMSIVGIAAFAIDWNRWRKKNYPKELRQQKQ